jgi:hypothetical protein
MSSVSKTVLMIESGAAFQFFGAMLLLTSTGVIARLLVLKHMSQSVTKASHISDLRPAQLAYLLREGDMSHTMIVLAVDLVQRSVKSVGSENALALEPYEKAVWGNVKDFTKQWAQQKVETVVSLKPTRNPLEWMVRFRALKAFVTGPLRRILHDLLKDPRQIRRYFSFAGIGRLAVELYAAGYKDKVEKELKSGLLQEGFLVTEKQRHTHALGLIAIIPLMIAGAVATSMWLLPKLGLSVLVLILMSLVCAAVIKGLLAIPGFIPIVEEISQVVSELSRESWRFRALRMLFRGAGFLLLLWGIALTGLLFLIDILIAKTLFSLEPLSTFAILSGLTALSVLVVQLILDAYSVALREQPTLQAQKQIDSTRAQLASVSPIGTLKELLTDPDYDETFSKIVAVYGIETLWLLG